MWNDWLKSTAVVCHDRCSSRQFVYSAGTPGYTFGPACELRSSPAGLSTSSSRSCRLRSLMVFLRFGDGRRRHGVLHVLSEIARDQQLPVGAKVLRVVVKNDLAV